jgi:hypothetical protein
MFVFQNSQFVLPEGGKHVPKHVKTNLSCSYPCTDATILRTNLTNALIYVLYSHLHVSALKGPSSESTDIFREQVNKMRVQI